MTALCVDGKIDREANDVYIGPGSRWHLTWYDHLSALGHAPTALAYVEESIMSTPDMRWRLTDLIGKRLVCSCRCKHSCHGHALLGLTRKLFPCEELCSEMGLKLFKDCVCFKGSKSIFSPWHKCELLMHGHRFSSVYHAFVWRRSASLGLRSLSERSLNCPTSANVTRCVRELNAARPLNIQDLCQILSLMYEILECKWDQCPEFSQSLRRHVRRVFLYAIDCNVWGCGNDLSAGFGSGASLLSAGGLNLYGWLLTVLLSVKTGAYTWSVCFPEIFSSPMKMGMGMCVKNLADGGCLPTYDHSRLKANYRTKEQRQRKKKRRRLCYDL